MRVFGQSMGKSNPSSTKMKKPKRVKEDLSAEEIRKRVAKGLNKKEVGDKKISSAGNRQVSQFMGESVAIKKQKPVANNKDVIKSAPEAEKKAKDFVLKSDVGPNNPDDDTTHGKLKSVLNSSSFGFSEKEKEVLSKILRN